MKYISVCSGIEAATVAWHSLGWEPVAFAEIDAFPSAVLAHHFPTVPNLGDISKVDWRPYHGTVDLVVGGTPCQSFSIAGKREGLDGASGLVFEYFRLLREVQPRWFVWENVPGSFSSNKGADFQSILREWDKCGYHVAWRVLDAQFFGVPQRRRRIFAVGHLGDWRYPAQVLFEPESLRGNTQKGGKARKDSPPGTKGRTRSHWKGGPHPSLTQSHNTGGIAMSNQELFAQGGAGLVGQPWPADKASCLNAHFGEKMGLENQHINQGAPLFVPCYPINMQIATRCEALGEGTGLGVGQDGDPGFTLQAAHSHAVCAPVSQYGEIAGALTARHDSSPCADRGMTIVGTLNASGAGTSRPAGQGNELDFLIPHPTIRSFLYAHAPEGNAASLLRTLREEVGEKAFTQWGFGILASLQPSEVLQQVLHGCGLRRTTFSRNWVVYCALSREKNNPDWLLQSLRETECEGCPPQGWQPSEQFARELGAYLSELSQPGAQAERFVRDLWEASEGTGILREALSAFQEMGRPVYDETQSALPRLAVRRLTPTEAEFLQGFPRNYTDIPWRGKDHAPDGPRYKALGNSMAVPCMRWIGERINNIEHQE